ncbi:hypothetical protein EMPG_12671 [Blastomyces silverae]|uniref:Uncharacterized protein n=1 Tax=Blastomyces silverae TaxID=2060906 RepID=A0A0H1BMA1_9EURO|nr:hypothetical protein EMPG_12671 [Blastomyces silverae]
MTSQASSHTSNSHHPATNLSALDTKTAASSRPSNGEQGHHRPPSATSPGTSQWQPKINRTQSWNEQDMKHQLQQRLTGLEKARESGFTESEGEVQREGKEGAITGGV